jgi:hypothetical protein
MDALVAVDAISLLLFVIMHHDEVQFTDNTTIQQ